MSKILIIRNAWHHDDFGGAEVFALDLTRELNKSHDAKFISGTKEPLKRAQQAKIPYLRGPRTFWLDFSGLKALGLPIFILGLVWGFIRYLVIFWQQHPTIVHITSRDDYISASLAARIVGAKIVWTDHAELRDTLKNLRHLVKGLPGKYVFLSARLADSIITVSENDKTIVNQITGSRYSDKLAVIKNGVVDEYSKEQPKYDFVFASRAIVQKGIVELLDAFADLHANQPDAKLLIASDTKVNESLINGYGALKSITFENYSDQAINSAKIFVLPSYAEGHSLALLKACMFKKPIITTEIPGTDEFLTHNQTAILVPVGDHKKLAQAMDSLLNDSAKQDKLADSARKLYKDRFSFSKMLDSYLSTYNLS